LSSTAQFQPILNAGTDKVILKGFSASELAAPAEQLLDGAPGRSPATG
jgi:hypothetical protein